LRISQYVIDEVIVGRAVLAAIRIRKSLAELKSANRFPSLFSEDSFFGLKG
jgi:hypothetical protein